MPEITLLGIVEFSTSLFCSADALGHSVDISIAGHTGIFSLPSLPEWAEREEYPQYKPLLGPAKARDWKRGKDLLFWGRLKSYLTGDATVDRALIELSLSGDNLKAASQQAYEDFGEWLDLFEKYVILLTAQNTHCHALSNDQPRGVELFIQENDGHKHISRTNPKGIKIVLSDEDEALHLEQLKEAARLSSQRLLPRFEYRLLLEAYSARKSRDYQKSIIEAANALEICLSARIMEECDRQGISSGDKLLQKFCMLGGRFELMKLLGISLPNKDYETLVNKPRNDMVKRGFFPDTALANQVITAVEELLRLFSPQVYQDKDEV